MTPRSVASVVAATTVTVPFLVFAIAAAWYDRIRAGLAPRPLSERERADVVAAIDRNNRKPGARSS